MKTKNLVTITTAQKLTPKQRSIVKELIGKRIGDTFETEEVVDPSVVGGIRIKLGEQEFDATIRGTLEKVDSLLEVIEVTTADPLTEIQRKRLRAALEAKLQRPFDLIEVVEPSVIAGLRLRVGSREFDGTYRKQLDRLQSKLTNEL